MPLSLTLLQIPLPLALLLLCLMNLFLLFPVDLNLDGQVPQQASLSMDSLQEDNVK